MNEHIEKRLIARGSGKWSLAGVPKRGWTCSGIDDLGTPEALCEMCEVQHIRYVHYMVHPKYRIELAVGCVCAGHMAEEYAAARDRERALKNSSRRRRNWLLRKWRISLSGNHYINTDGFNIVIFPIEKAWSARIAEIGKQAPYFAKKRYKTEDEAKLAAFSAMIFLKQRIVKS